jgi:hypothetical protein
VWRSTVTAKAPLTGKKAENKAIFNLIHVSLNILP